MRIEFHNVPIHPMDCNTAVFKLKGGGEITVDRDVTENLGKNMDGTYNMLWRNVYLWAINDHRVFSEPAYLYDVDAENLLKEAELIFFEVDDEAEDIEYDFSGVVCAI